MEPTKDTKNFLELLQHYFISRSYMVFGAIRYCTSNSSILKSAVDTSGSQSSRGLQGALAFVFLSSRRPRSFSFNRSLRWVASPTTGFLGLRHGITILGNYTPHPQHICYSPVPGGGQKLSCYSKRGREGTGEGFFLAYILSHIRIYF
jgi:hypothetical protein